MAQRKVEFAIDEWYHCYNRGVEKRTTYEDAPDYWRFFEQMYLANSTEVTRRDDLGKRNTEEIFQIPRAEPLVAIGAFCLMPNHFHLLLKEITEGGITAFMQKLGTAYTMYFNARYERTGNLFMKPFRARHVPDDRYFQYLVNYIHSNPAELYAPKWKTGRTGVIHTLTKKLIDYPYSSLGAFQNKQAPMRILLDECVFDVIRPASPQRMLADAKVHYLEQFDENME